MSTDCLDTSDEQQLLQEWTDRTVRWIGSIVEEAGCVGTVVGVSGGIDSAVTAALCVRATPDNALAAILPCESLPEDTEDARLVVDSLDMESILIDLDEAYHSLVSQLPLGEPTRRDISLSNVKPRLRMTTLYYLAQSRNSLVVGTDNRAELYLGYFTKYGDGGVDIMPMARLSKGQVRTVARYLGIPDKIIDRPPSAGLWPGQTDEKELGISYDDIDRYLLHGEADEDVKQQIEGIHRANEHKLTVPPIPPFDLSKELVSSGRGEA